MNAKRRRQGRQRRKSGIGGELLFIVVLFLGCGIAIFAMFVNMIAPLASANDVEFNRALENHSYEPWAQNSTTEQIGNHASPIGMVPTEIRNITDTGYLALINRRHAVSAELGSGLVPVWPTVPVSQSAEMLLHPTALQAVADMFDAARIAGVGSFFVSSGFRGYDTQAVLYNNGINGAYALPPGHGMNANEPETDKKLRTGGLVMDDEKKRVTVDDEEVSLTPLEYNILYLLVANQDRVFSSAQIYEAVWNEPAFHVSKTVSVHISNIREKIEINPKEPRYLKVVYGLGYKVVKMK